MSRRDRSAPATETLREIESALDRLAGWVIHNPRRFLTGLGTVMLLAASVGFYQWYDGRRNARASAEVAEILSGYLTAMGAAPGSFDVVEPANPEMGQRVRRETIEKFLAAARAHEGTAAAISARLEAANLQQQAGEAEAALDSWRQAADAAPSRSALRAVALVRLARGLEEKGRFGEAAEAHAEAGSIAAFPARHLAQGDAARCFAEAGDTSRAVAIFEELEQSAPDVALPQHIAARLRELQARERL